MCEILYHCIVTYIFLMTNDIEYFFKFFCQPFEYLFREISIEVLCSLFSGFVVVVVVVFVIEL